MINRLSKEDLLANKQDLLNLKEEFAKLKKTLIEPDPSSTTSDDFQDFESYESQQTKYVSVDNQSDTGKVSSMPHSTTSDSISESHGKGYTPSMTSSGYGSQAVSTLTLSSEDSLSLRSNEDSEMVRAARKAGLEQGSSGESDGDVELVQRRGSAIIGGSEGLLEKTEQSGSDATLESMDNERVKGEEDDKVTVVDDVELASQSDLIDDTNDAEQGLKLHISETDLINELNSNKVENSQVNVQCETDKHKPDSDTVFSSEDKTSMLHDTEDEKAVNTCQKDSCSSSNTSRGMVHSESFDPYSLEAMEELERLGEECGNDNSEFLSMNETNDSAIDNNTSNNAVAKSDTNAPKPDHLLNVSLDLNPDHQSTPKRADKRLGDVGSAGRQRPMSMYVSSENDLLDASLQERSKRSSLDLSDEHLSGKQNLGISRLS